jgi:hypothetical protein
LWAQLEREFAVYKPFADAVRRQTEAREAQRDGSGQLGRNAEEELGALYVDYMSLQVCAEHFQQFENATSRLREFLRNKESAIPRAVTDRLWDSMAQKFQKIEVGLAQTSNAQLYAACEQASKQAFALITRATAEPAEGPALRKKDF